MASRRGIVGGFLDGPEEREGESCNKAPEGFNIHMAEQEYTKWSGKHTGGSVPTYFKRIFSILRVKLKYWEVQITKDQHPLNHFLGTVKKKTRKLLF